MPSSRGSSPPRDQTRVSHGSCNGGRFFTEEPLGNFCLAVFNSCDFFFFLNRTTWHVGFFLTRDQTRAPCAESMRS